VADPRPARAQRPATNGWTLVLPVKHAELAKSRLATPAGVDRVALARAIALDSLRAVVECTAVGRLVVVTSDPVVSAAAARGAEVVADPAAGLLGAVHAGVVHVRAQGADPLAVLLADVPALRPPDLAVALDRCGEHPAAFVPDAEGTGTVLLAATVPARLLPAFGPRSAARHEAGGAVRLDLDLPSLRRDVDTWEALQQALTLGVGPRTAAVTAGAR
jgi:2-phospho-L-lactate/phosphoenolpyruvate guanylyltransferase